MGTVEDEFRRSDINVSSGRARKCPRGEGLRLQKDRAAPRPVREKTRRGATLEISGHWTREESLQVSKLQGQVI